MRPEAFSVGEWIAIFGGIAAIGVFASKVWNLKTWVHGEVQKEIAEYLRTDAARELRFISARDYLDSQSGRAQVETIAASAVRLDLTQLINKLDRLTDEIKRLVESDNRRNESIATMQADLATLKARSARES